MTAAASLRRPFAQRLARRAEQAVRDFRRKAGWLARVSGDPGARLGVYVAYYDASWVFEDHLRCIRDLASGPFNYYVMGSCTTAAERAWFDKTIARHGFPIPFFPWPANMPLDHGESLQRMVEATSDDVIVLCDVDAFPVRRGWDDFVLAEIASKDVVAAAVDMPGRAMPVFLHPSFMALRRGLLVDNGLDLLPGEGNDPAWRVTEHLMKCGRLTPEHVCALFPTKREVAIYPKGANRLFGRDDLVHGFGTTYGDLVFHYWFARYISRQEEPKDEHGNVVLSLDQIDRVLRQTRAWVGDLCP